LRRGLTTDSLGQLPFDELLETAANLGIQTLEFGCGGWASAPHLDLNTLLGSEAERASFLVKIRAQGLEISALNCTNNRSSFYEGRELCQMVYSPSMSILVALHKLRTKRKEEFTG
jgi:sugar phosphate isomerase/epimerase